MDRVAFFYRAGQFLISAAIWLFALSLLFVIFVTWIGLVYLAWVTGVEIAEDIARAWGIR